MMQDKYPAGLLLLHHILPDHIACPKIIRYDRAVSLSVAVKLRVNDNDPDSKPLCPVKHVGEAIGGDRCHDEGADSHGEHRIDLLSLTIRVETRVTQDHLIPLPLDSDADLLIDDIIELIIHGHITGAYEPRILCSLL